MIKICETKLADIFSALAEKQSLYMPVDKNDGEAEFTKWEKETVYSKAQNTVRSAKDFFFPKKEDLYEIKMEGKNLEVIDTRKESEDFIVFGVKACDAKAFSIIDRVYLEQDPVDTYYKNRRSHATVFTMACNESAPTCFCTLFDIDAANPSGTKKAYGDVSCWMNAGNVWFEAKTEKGKKLLDSMKDAFTKAGAEFDADTKEVEDLKEDIKAVMSEQTFAHENLDQFKGENLNKLFNSSKWNELSQSCLACGTCTYVCPTCMCYNIKDYDTGHGIKRFRTWDSCMYSDFTKMAAENSRNSQLQRFRQRFMHKLVYYPAKYENTYACVGCGRCLQKCPISQNIVKVIRTLNADEECKTTKGDN